MARFRTVLALALAAAGQLSAQRPAPALASADWDFVMAVARANLYESKAASLAKSKSSSAAVKTFAEELSADHGKLDSDLKGAAKRADPDLKYPDQMDGAHAKTLDALDRAPGFDATFKQQMVSTHTAAVEMVQAYLAKSGTTPDIRAVATAALPVIQRHLEHARSLP